MPSHDLAPYHSGRYFTIYCRYSLAHGTRASLGLLVGCDMLFPDDDASNGAPEPHYRLPHSVASLEALNFGSRLQVPHQCTRHSRTAPFSTPDMDACSRIERDFMQSP